MSDTQLKEKSVVLAAMNRLHWEVCAMLDCGDLAPNYGEGTPREHPGLAWNPLWFSQALPFAQSSLNSP